MFRLAQRGLLGAAGLGSQPARTLMTSSLPPRRRKLKRFVEAAINNTVSNNTEPLKSTGPTRHLGDNFPLYQSMSPLDMPLWPSDGSSAAWQHSEMKFGEHDFHDTISVRRFDNVSPDKFIVEFNYGTEKLATSTLKKRGLKMRKHRVKKRRKLLRKKNQK